jgi:hypothetical protein
MGALTAFDGGSAVNRRVVGCSAAFGEVAEGYGSPGFDALAAGAGSEVAVLEPVAVAFEAENLGVMD